MKIKKILHPVGNLVNLTWRQEKFFEATLTLIGTYLDIAEVNGTIVYNLID